jgi:hypothetical protein
MTRVRTRGRVQLRGRQGFLMTRTLRDRVRVVLLALAPALSITACAEPEEGARRIMADPLVREAVARFDPRYAIGVSTIRSTERFSKEVRPELGGSWGSEDRTMSAHIWDLKEAEVLGTLIVAASSKLVAVPVADLFGLPGAIGHSVPTDTVACRALGRHLAQFLSGREIAASPSQ